MKVVGIGGLAEIAVMKRRGRLPYDPLEELGEGYEARIAADRSGLGDLHLAAEHLRIGAERQALTTSG